MRILAAPQPCARPAQGARRIMNLPSHGSARRAQLRAAALRLAGRRRSQQGLARGQLLGVGLGETTHKRRVAAEILERQEFFLQALAGVGFDVFVLHQPGDQFLDELLAGGTLSVFQLDPSWG